ncbi:MAG: hypothetical protein RQ745_05870 [Longimicrobiales bacterium]|nr:hypothetical protein [Longimicrobiales bacterium]
MGDRLFLDANVLFSAAWRESAGIQRLWDLPRAELLTSAYAVEEARRNVTTSARRMRLDALLEAVDVRPASMLPDSLRGEVELPDKDWPILSGAVLSGATHLITGDLRDFGAWFGATILGVRILPSADYLRSSEEEEG